MPYSIEFRNVLLVYWINLEDTAWVYAILVWGLNAVHMLF